jgi:holin-like protein
MQYLYQFLWIVTFTFLGETLSLVIPLPVPASIYGLLLLFLGLQLKLVKLEQVKTAGDWLIGIMGILFVAPVVNLLGCWDLIAPHLIPITVIVLVTTVVVFAVSGKLTELFTKKKEEEDPHD